jgi:hypothetical protein
LNYVAGPGRPKGLENKHKPFRAALNRLLLSSGSHPDLLDEIALALANRAKRGDVAAAQEIANRLDGRVPVQVGGASELGPVLIGWRGDLHELEHGDIDTKLIEAQPNRTNSDD